MASTLKQILELFELASRPLTLPEMARILGLEQEMLESMIEYWVRKGKIRESGDTASQCVLCGESEACPFIMKSPRRYELVTGPLPPPGEKPPCSCCG